MNSDALSGGGGGDSGGGDAFDGPNGHARRGPSLRAVRERVGGQERGIEKTWEEERRREVKPR
jgi:hypothetical protein